MRNVTLFVTLVMFTLSANSWALCDWSTGITEAKDGWVYSESCHKKVGLMVKEIEDLNQEIEKLRLSLNYKDQTIEKQDQRIDLWRKTSYDLEDKVTAFEKWKNTNQTLYFFLGVAFTGLAVWGAGQLHK